MTNRMKSSPALVAIFEAAIAARPALQRRLMFGCPCAFLNDNLVSGVVKNQLMMRLAEKDRAKAAAEGATPFMMRGGKPTREYIVLPADTVADKRRLGAWLKRAIAHVETLPAKKPKKPKLG
jgi:TfoX/Sxy family transcriptional regulator of competence genes